GRGRTTRHRGRRGGNAPSWTPTVEVDSSFGGWALRRPPSRGHTSPRTAHPTSLSWLTRGDFAPVSAGLAWVHSLSCQRKRPCTQASGSRCMTATSPRNSLAGKRRRSWRTMRFRPRLQRRPLKGGGLTHGAHRFPRVIHGWLTWRGTKRLACFVKDRKRRGARHDRQDSWSGLLCPWIRRGELASLLHPLERVQAGRLSHPR